MQAITETKCEPVFEWIKEQFAERLAFPTMREIADVGFEGVSSASQARMRIQQMHELGWLERYQVGSTWKYRIKGATVIYGGLTAEPLSSLSVVEGGDAIES